jgi:NAD(P)-dependent dehydrogenase (short-subunit alcohol dehydrogenase family)
MKMDNSVVVTGAASGIGRAIAERLAKEFIVILVDVNVKLLPEVESGIVAKGGKAFICVGDVAERETHKKAVDLANQRAPLTSYVNCAGWTRGAPLHDFPDDPKVLAELIAVNQIGTFFGCAEAVHSFIETKLPGTIVNISSVHGRRAWRDHAVYEMTKGAVDSLTRNVAVVYGPYGIRANAVAPGAIMTPALKQSFIDAPDSVERRSALEKLTPLKRIAEATEIAEVVAFLLSPLSSYLSGQSIAVDGAWTAALGVGDLDPELGAKFGLNIQTGLAE